MAKTKLFEDDVYSKDFRAKQFLPYNSLRGLTSMIKKEEIIRVERKILSEDELELLQDKFQDVNKGKMVKIKYYKEYGYVIIEGMVSNIDLIYRSITIVKTKINLDDIIDVEVIS